MQIHYLEIVTREVEAICAAYEAANGVKFGRPDSGVVGVRAPLRETETPVVRPYWLVDNIEAAVERHGTFAIYLQGGIDHGLWQL
jgi:uncharacterized protein